MTEHVGLRARKKIKIRQAIIDKAWELFTAKGFENVRVADIADGADVSVKTLFAYFRSKEDIVFSGEDELLDEIIQAIRSRKPGHSVVDTVISLVKTHSKENNSAAYVEKDSLAELIMSNPIIQRRLLVMWRKYEEKLRDTLIEELCMKPGDPRAEVIACNLVLPFRMIFQLKIKGDEQALSNPRWFNKLMATIKNGIGDF